MRKIRRSVKRIKDKRIQKYLKYINEYCKAQNAATGSKYDSNANVSNKNVATLNGELFKGESIFINRLRMFNKLEELFGTKEAELYLWLLENHYIYRHDETSPLHPYCVSVSMYPFLFNGLKNIGGISEAPKNLQSFCGSFINFIFILSSQFAGAVATPEFLTYFDYFARKEFGENYMNTLDEIVFISDTKTKTITDCLNGYFQQIVYSINQPASARNFQSVFWNISYFDREYFKAIFENLVFPDGTEPNSESVMKLQLYFMKWFRDERKRSVDLELTFPVENGCAIDDGVNDYKDKDTMDRWSEIWASGHEFFLYHSSSADSLASCCFSGKQKVLTRSSTNGVKNMTFEELYNTKYKDTKRNFKVFHNGGWVKGRVIRLKGRPLYKITTVNHKEILVTDNHINPTLRGEISSDQLNTDDYLLFSTLPLKSVPEQDKRMTYEQGFLIGMYLGDGSKYKVKDCESYRVTMSLNKEKIANTLEILKKATKETTTKEVDWYICSEQHNAQNVQITSKEIYDFINEYVQGKHAQDKSINLNVLTQSEEFRKGIIDGVYATDGGNSNRIYSTSRRMIEDLEVIMTSLGMCSIIDESDRTNEKILIRREEFSRNFPLYCIRFYDRGLKRNMKDIYIVRNNSVYFKVKEIEKLEKEDWCYCFEMENQDEPYFTLPNGIITHNCRLSNGFSDNTFSTSMGVGGISTGSKGVITINFNRCIQDLAEKKGLYKVLKKDFLKMGFEDCWMNEDNFERFAIPITVLTNHIHNFLIAWNEILKTQLEANMMPIYTEGYISLEKQFLTIGINGFLESAEYLGIDITSEDYSDYAETLLSSIKEANRAAKTDKVMFNTEFVPAENLGIKHAKWDKEDGYFVPREVYNSYFYPVEDDSLNIYDRMALQGGSFAESLDGGSACHNNLKEPLTAKQYRTQMNNAVILGCPQFVNNVPNTICPECNKKYKKMLWKCPNCGNENLEWETRIIGYWKRVSNWSEQRQKEHKRRVYK